MVDPSPEQKSSLAPNFAAPQHRPRPLPLFLSMLRSMTAQEPARLAASLAGLRLYQEAPRCAPHSSAPALAAHAGATLRHYGGKGPAIVFVPSLINPPNILDLTPDRSLLAWLADQGFRPMLLDWGWPDERRRGFDIGDHVTQLLLPLLRTLDAPPHLVGYCLGGTMATAAAQLTPVRSLTTIAAPWHFSGYPDEARLMLSELWQASRGTVDALHLLPMEVLQAAFWQLDPERTVSKFEDLPSRSAEQLRQFVILEDWSNDGPPLTSGAAREMFEDLFGADLPGRGVWQVGGATIRADPPLPQLTIVSTTDRIVPAASATNAGQRLELDLGHVGMIVGSQARQRLWEPLASWLSSC